MLRGASKKSMLRSSGRENTGRHESLARLDSSPRGRWIRRCALVIRRRSTGDRAVVMHWAREHGFIVFTHDLGFGAILASTGATGPSVLQVRTQDVTPEHIGELVIGAFHQFEAVLLRGAIISVD